MEETTQPSGYREKLLKEIEEIPDDMIPTLYRIVRLLKNGFAPRTEKSGQRGSLRGIWKGSQIDDDLVREAKESLFPHESQ